jgi:hypothetical protein
MFTLSVLWCVQVEWQKDQVTLDTSNPNYYASSQGPAFTLTILKYDITLLYIQREFNPPPPAPYRS